MGQALSGWVAVLLRYRMGHDLIEQCSIVRFKVRGVCDVPDEPVKVQHPFSGFEFLKREHSCLGGQAVAEIVRVPLGVVTVRSCRSEPRAAASSSANDTPKASGICRRNWALMS